MGDPRVKERGWPDEVTAVIQQLQSAGYEAFLVGGCVRDTLLGREVHDYDVATNARPNAVMALFPRTVPTGLKHGTVTVLMPAVSVEVTTYRVDLEYTDGRRPSGVHFTDNIEADLSRRDFTINAMALPLTGEVVDPFGGQHHLVTQQICAVGEAQERFQEDGLRILRALRFAAQLSFAISRDTTAAMRAQASMLKCVSSERIGQELAKLARSDWFGVAAELSEGPYLDELPNPMSSFRPAFTCLTQYARMDSGLPGTWRLTTTALAAQWPRCDVPLVSSVATWVWLSNLPLSALHPLARQLGWAKEWSGFIQEVVEWLCQDPGTFDERKWKQVLFTGHPVCLAVACAILDVFRKPETTTQPRYSAFTEAVSQQPIHTLQDLKVDGHDMLALGMRGPKIGIVLQELACAVLSGRVQNERQPLLAYVESHALREREI